MTGNHQEKTPEIPNLKKTYNQHMYHEKLEGLKSYESTVHGFAAEFFWNL